MMWGKTRAGLREAWDWYSQIQLRRYKMWNNQGSFYSRVNISKTNHPWYAYQIPFADIVLCNTALWVEYHQDYMGSSCSPSYFALYLSRFHSLSVLWSPNIIQHNGISTESLHCALDTHSSANRQVHIPVQNGHRWAYNAKGHKEYSINCIWRIECCNLNLIIGWGAGLNLWWVHCTHSTLICSFSLIQSLFVTASMIPPSQTHTLCFLSKLFSLFIPFHSVSLFLSTSLFVIPLSLPSDCHGYRWLWLRLRRKALCLNEYNINWPVPGGLFK